MPPKKVMRTSVAMKICKRAPATKSQRKKIAKCAPMKRVAKKLPAAVANRMGWLVWASRNNEDGPCDSTSMHVDADAMNQFAEWNHAHWLRVSKKNEEAGIGAKEAEHEGGDGCLSSEHVNQNLSEGP